MPDDIILNTRRTYSVSATTTTGYSALGVPEGRYIAPASPRDCVCATTGGSFRARIVLGPDRARFLRAANFPTPPAAIAS